MGQSHSRRPEAQTNGSASSTAADRVDGAPDGRSTKEVKKEQAHRLRNASTSSAKPTHTRNKSNATDRESGNKWRKRLSSTFGKHRRSSRIGKELLGNGAQEVDEAGLANGAAETTVDGPRVDEYQGAEAERRELTGVEQGASPAAATSTPSTPRRATEDAGEARPLTDRGPNVPTSPSSELHSHDDARHDHPIPQSSPPSTSSPPASTTNAVQSSAPSPPNAPTSASDSATNAPNNASDASANNATPTPTHAPPTGVLLVQGIVQTHNIRVDSEDRSSSPEPASSPESENVLSDPEAYEDSEAPVTASTTPAAQPTATASDAEAAPSAGGERDQAQASNSSIQEQGSTSTRRRLSTLFSSLRRSSGERAARAPASREHSAAGSRTSLASVGPEETAAELTASATNAGEEQPLEDVRPSDVVPPPRPARVDPPLPNHTIDVLSTYLSLAAAATAASLLTGSADPIVNSGLVGQRDGENGTGAASQSTEPTSPLADTVENAPQPRNANTPSASATPTVVPPPRLEPTVPASVVAPPRPAVPPQTPIIGASTVAPPVTASRPSPASASASPPITPSLPTLPVSPPSTAARRPGRRYQGNRARSAYDRLGLTSSARRGGRREEPEEPTASTSGRPGAADEEEVEEVIGWRRPEASSSSSATTPPATSAPEEAPADASAGDLPAVSEATSDVVETPAKEPAVEVAATSAEPSPATSTSDTAAPSTTIADEAGPSTVAPTPSRRDILMEQLAQRREQHRREEERLSRQLEQTRAEERERRDRSRERRRAVRAAMGSPYRSPSSSTPSSPSAVPPPASTNTASGVPPPSSAGLAELARALRGRLGIPQDDEHEHELGADHAQDTDHHHAPEDDIWAPFSDDDDDDIFGSDLGSDANLSPTSFESFLRDLRSELRTALGGGATPPPDDNAEDGEGHDDMPDLEPVNAPRSPTSLVEDHDEDMPALEAVEAAAAQRPRRAAPVPGLASATAGTRERNERDRLLDVLAGIGGLIGSAEGGASRARQRSSMASARRSRSVPSAPPPPSEPQPLTALGGVRSSGGRRASPDGGVNWWSMYRFAPVVVSPVHPANINNAAATPTGPPSNTPTAPGSEPASPTSPTSPTNATGTRSPLSDAHVVFPVIIVGIQSIENIFGLGMEHATMPPPPATTDSQARDDETTPLLDAQEGDDDGLPDADQPIADEAGRVPWRSRAADTIRRTIRRARGTATEDGAAQTDGGDGARASEAPSSRTFAMYVIGAYYPPSHALLNSPPPPTFDALLELADLANLGNLGAIGLAMGGLGSRAATVSKEQITKSKLIVVKAKDLVVWTPKEGEKESDTKGTAVRDNCIERCLICLDAYEPEDDVRVMSCRHAFHKNCVDTWMETGKNNCPFCRGKGVDTTNTPASTAAAV